MIFELISQIRNCDQALLNEETVLIEIGVNSLIYIEILVKLEQLFDIEIDDDDLIFSTAFTIGDLFNIVDRTMKSSSECGVMEM